MAIIRHRPIWETRCVRLVICAALLAALSGLLWPQSGYAQPNVGHPVQQSLDGPLAPAAPQGTALPLIRVPYFADGANPGQGAIFWFGKVEPAANYADVRIAYDDEALVVMMHVFDRRVSYDPTASTGSDLSQFDSVTLYLDAHTDLSAPLGAGTRRFDAAVNFFEARTNYQQAYAWQVGAWKPAAIDFKTESGFRANLNDEGDDSGWLMRYRVPFASLGLSSTPASGSVLRMALLLHDRDELEKSALPDQRWPHNALADQPATWGRIALGVPNYTAPFVSDPQQLTLRHGVDGVTAPDAAVGGHSTCGADYNPRFFDGWGEANYDGFAQFNIQNQWDVADWPCFSKFYITFPLDALPGTSSIVSATLTMYLFGNAGYDSDDAKPSYIQVARIVEDWSEQTITWNNAPPLMENYGWAWVNPYDGSNYAQERTWDLSRAVADAHTSGQPLRLVIYSTDGDYHSGKYFWSADAGANYRPRLQISSGYAGFALAAAPVKTMIQSGETASYELKIAGLRTGEAATLALGQSSPPGLEVVLSNDRVAAPGGQVTALLTDKDGSVQARVYRVPVTAHSGSDTRTAEMLVLVNGKKLYLPALRR
jgi:hypothetical protein